MFFKGLGLRLPLIYIDMRFFVVILRVNRICVGSGG